MADQTIIYTGNVSTTTATQARLASITIPRSTSGILTMAVTAQGPGGAFASVAIVGNVVRGAGQPLWNGTTVVTQGPVGFDDGPEVIVGDGDSGISEVLTVDVTGLAATAITWKGTATLHIVA